jgi:HYR domain
MMIFFKNNFLIKTNFMRKIFLALTFFLLLTVAHTQVQEVWSTSHGGGAADMTVDAAGNVYLFGRTNGETLLFKHDKEGNEKWTRTVNVGIPSAITVDASGNVYIIGRLSRHYITAKYNSSGIIQWSNSYFEDDVEGHPNAIAVDLDGNVYVTGRSYTGFVPGTFIPDETTADYATVKYNSEGDEIWVRRYNGASPANGFDAATAITVDAIGNIYVTGTSQLNGQFDIATIKYKPNGDVLWINRFDGSAGEQDGATDILLDASGNVIVVGLSRKATAQESDVYRDAVIVKYTFSGFQLWNRRVFNDTYHHVGLDVEIDAANNIIVGGYSEIEAPGTQFIAKYNPFGDQQWLVINSGVDGRGSEIGTDGINIYTVGFGGASTMVTKKFNADGLEQWTMNRGYTSNSSHGLDFRCVIAIDANQNVFSTTTSEYHTVRYSQCTISISSTIVVNTEPGQCGAIVNWGATTTGDCGDIVYQNSSGSVSYTPGSFLNRGHYHIVARSLSTGEEAFFTIRVNDNELPVISCPSDKTVNTDPGVCYATATSVGAGTATATDNCNTTVVGTRSDNQPLNANYPGGVTTITWKATDPSGNSSTCTQTITIEDNEPPVITGELASTYVLSPPNHTMRDVSIDYTISDNCTYVDTTVTVTSNEPINGTGDGDTDPDWIVVDKKNLKLRAERSANGSGRTYTITITATDGSGNTAVKTIEVKVPHNIKKPHSGQSFIVGSTVNFEGEFWDKPGKVHTGKWVIDGSTLVNGNVTEPSGNQNGKLTGSYKFNTPGVYKLQMNTTDQFGVMNYSNTNGDLEAIVVIYDPNGGHAYGGGWYQSPTGALNGSPNATGKASYGFAINYRTAAKPKGETQFEFKVGTFEFNALNFEYLSVAGAKAQFRGTGRIIGGQSGVSFIMTVTDGALDATGIDKIRLKIFKNGQVYYDSQPGASDAANPTTAVGTNSIIFIQNNQQQLITQSKATSETETIADMFELIAWPNPTAEKFSVQVKSNDVKTKILLQLFDQNGRVVKKQDNVTAGSVMQLGNLYKPGIFYIRAIQGKEHRELKLVKLSD